MASAEEFPGEFQAGDIVGDTYVVLDYIGRGAMGHVYQVRHQMLNAEYALKALSSDRVTDLAWRRFQNEAQAIAIMQHPNVVGIYNLGLHKGVLPYYVMDLLVGIDLAEKIHSDGALEFRQACAIFIEVCAGIGYAHKKGIVHRDIKPSNIFLLEKPGAAGEKIKVVDFGIAKLAETKDSANQGLTAMGDVVGTPYYMSPEQCMGQRVDARSDIYSLGCTLFEALTCSLPFRASSPTATMLLHQAELPPSLHKAASGKEFPGDLEYIVATMLAKEPAERYQTMEQLSKDLAAVMDGDKTIAIAAGGAIIDQVVPAPTVQIQKIAEAPDNYKLLLVSSVVAIILTVGVFAYYQYDRMVKESQKLRSTGPMSSLSTGPAEMGIESPESERLVLDEQASKLEAQTDSNRLPANQIVTASLLMKQPFTTFESEDGKTIRCFDFPKDVVIGLLRGKSEEWAVQAIGEVKYPRRQRLTFMPSEIVGRYPDCLKRFLPGDIYCVRFDSGHCTASIIEATLNISGVERLDFTDCRTLTAKSLAAIALYHRFDSLEISNSNIDASTLARAKWLESLKDFKQASAKDILPLLQALKGAKQLRKLNLCRSKFSRQEFQTLGGFTELTQLDLGGCPMTKDDLAMLTGLQDLTELSLQNTGINDTAAETLQVFKALKKLHIKCKGVNKAQQKRIKEALPSVRIM